MFFRHIQALQPAHGGSFEALLRGLPGYCSVHIFDKVWGRLQHGICPHIATQSYVWNIFRAFWRRGSTRKPVLASRVSWRSSRLLSHDSTFFFPWMQGENNMRVAIWRKQSCKSLVWTWEACPGLISHATELSWGTIDSEIGSFRLGILLPSYDTMCQHKTT